MLSFLKSLLVPLEQWLLSKALEYLIKNAHKFSKGEWEIAIGVNDKNATVAITVTRMGMTGAVIILQPLNLSAAHQKSLQDLISKVAGDQLEKLTNMIGKAGGS